MNLKKIKLSNKKPIILWGAGQGGRDALSIINNYDDLVIGFIDSNPELDGTFISGIPVYSPKFIDGIRQDFIIIISSVYYEQISETLIQMGYQHEHHFITILEYLVEYEPGGDYSPELFVKKSISALTHINNIKGSSILVLGSGTFPAVEIAAVLAGAKQTMSIDIINIPKYPYVTKAYGFYKKFIDLLVSTEEFLVLCQDNYLKSRLDKIFVFENDTISLNTDCFGFHHGSAEFIPVEKETYDYILSQAVMEHLSNPPCVIKEIKRVLKSGGISFHQIDLRDHRNFEKPFEFLYMSRSQWIEIQETVDFCSGNSYRGIEYWNWFIKEGFSIESYIPQIKYYEDKKFERLDSQRVHNDYIYFCNEELRLQSCFISVKKKPLSDKV